MSQNNKIDFWLQRIGYLSQIGTLIVMVITIFYTVMPLYRTASLEESISKKEIELKLLTNKIKKYETKERSLVLAGYVSRVSYDCTSLSKPSSLSSFSINTPPEKHKLTMLSENIEDCLKKQEYVDNVINNLSSEDKLTFKINLDLLIDKIGKLRKEKIAEYYNVENKLKNNEISVVDNNDPDYVILLDSLARQAGASDESINEAKKHSYLDLLEAKFEEDIRQEIHKFTELKWNDN